MQWKYNTLQLIAACFFLPAEQGRVSKQLWRQGRGGIFRPKLLIWWRRGSGHSCLKRESHNSFLLTFYLQVMQAIQVEIFYILRSTSLNPKFKFSTLLDSMERGLDNTSLTRQGLVWPSIERIICCLLSDGGCVFVFCKRFTVLRYLYHHTGLNWGIFLWGRGSD